MRNEAYSETHENKQCFTHRIKEKHVAVLMAGGGEDTGNQLLKALDRKAGRSHNGSSYRWAVAVAESGDLQLELQVIPLPLSQVTAKPQLLEDSAAVHVAKAWPITATYFNGSVGLRGPVPVLFAEQPEELRSRISRDPSTFMLHLNRAMKR
jgi:hypothetical protein